MDTVQLLHDENDAIETADPIARTAKDHFGINYLFPYQRLVISNILEADEELLCEADTDPVTKQIVILPTGAGKSLCFMLPALRISGPTLVIFPLLSLISDQLRRCAEAGIPAAGLTGGQTETERKRILRDVGTGRIRMVMSNPETAASDRMLPALRECGFRHLVFDEVHTVSEWGDSFRPAYLESRRIYIEADIPLITAFTATASETVLSRVKEVLFPDGNPHLVSANPDRPNIAYTVFPTLSKTASLCSMIREVRKPALIFCATRKTAEKTALLLRLRLKSDEVFFYHAGLEKDEKAEVEKWFFKSATGVLCATCAYGMGIDKPNIRTVIHFNLSPSVEAYLQESGRAGRDRSPAEAVLLYSPSDREDSERKSGGAADPRYQALLGFAENSGVCRRETLVRLLGAEPDTCFGCDVCRGNVRTTAEWQDEAVSAVRHNRRLLTTAGASRMLQEQQPELEDREASEIFSQLLSAGIIRQYRRGPWKGLLTC